MYDIIISNNTGPLRLQEIYKSYGKTLTIDRIATKYVGFTSIDLLYKNRKELKCVPILFSNSKETIKIKLDLNPYFLDTTFLKTGEILFHDINIEKVLLLSRRKKKFPNFYMYAVDNKETKKYKKSKFSFYLHKVLNSIPILLHEPLLVSLTNIFISNNINLFFDFLDINRIVTFNNNEFIKILTDILYDILKNGTKNLTIKDKIKLSLLYKLNKIKDIKNYIDHEKTVTL